MKSKFRFIWIFLFLTGFFCGIFATGVVVAKEPVYLYLENFQKVYQLIKASYVEKPNNKKLFTGAINGMVQSLNDPYSVYLNQDDNSSFEKQISGGFVGIGVEISVANEQIIVISPMAGSPAEKAGILAGDIIEKIDNISLKDKAVSDIAKLMQGKKNSKIKISVQRKGFEDLLVYEIRRKKISVTPVKYSVLEYQNDDRKNLHTGYLHLTLFSANSAKEFEIALKKLQDEKVDNLIIDLRGNPGGRIDQAQEIADFFLPVKKTIVSVKGRNNSLNEKYYSEHEALFKKDVIILLNNSSASASEILAAALSDNNRAEIVGEKSFGKGTVQTKYELNDNDALKLTVARYYTPKGRCIDHIGIEPDYFVKSDLLIDKDYNNAKIIVEQGLISEFNKEHNEITLANFYLLKDFLMRKNLKISDSGLRFLYKNEFYKNKIRPVYNLNFDKQLNYALEKINE